MRRRVLWFVPVAPMLVAGCILGIETQGEPTDAQLRAAFDQNRRVLDELRRMFQEDVERRGIWAISGATIDDAACEDRSRGSACLDADRWTQYASMLKLPGVQWIRRQDTPGIYFEMSESRSPAAWIGGFRWRGVVYAPGFPKVVHKHDDTEERVDLGDGWYSYLIMDE